MLEESLKFNLVEFIFFVILSLIFVLLNGFFVAAEFALVGVRRTKIEELALKGSGRAKAVLNALEHQDTVISATQLGITLSSLALGFVAGSYFEPVIEALIEEFLPILTNFSFFISISFGALFAIFLTTYAHVVLGELVFKSIALQYPESTSIWVAKPLAVFSKLTSPLIKIFNGSAWLILRGFGMKPVSGSQNVYSEDELKLIISQSKAAGILEEHETEILSRTFDLTDTTVREIMTPRTELTLIDIKDKFTNILDRILESGHSRFPVFENTPDNIIGFLYAKDVLQYFKAVLLENNKEEFNPDIKAILREPEFVPESMHADKILEKMLNNKKQVAIVITEFGGVAGLISLEDVIELLVGDIQDEYDLEPPDVLNTELGDIINGTMSLDDFNDHFNTHYESDHAVTFGGFIIEKLGRIPLESDSITIDNFNITIQNVTKNKINELLVQPISRTQEEIKTEENKIKRNGKTE